jgi:transcriptional regulator with XRE-family HTH domain
MDIENSKGYPKLKALLISRGIKQKEMAELLNIKTSTFNNKLSGISDFNMKEARILCEHLNIKSNIFLHHSRKQTKYFKGGRHAQC